MKTKTFSLSKIAIATLCLAGAAVTVQAEENAAKATLDMNLRYENVDQGAKDADALTLRTRLTYQTATVNNFSAVVEFEDSRVIAGMDDYKFGGMDSSNTTDSVIADPETTELDQAFVQYKKDKFTAKVGRQVITLDGHRFVGHVGWRQDRQTFDAATFSYAASDKLNASYSYISKRNRIFAELADQDSSDHLFNVSYKTSVGKLVGYSYLLDQDGGAEIDTYGVSLTGAKDKFGYAVEYATQENGDFDADYLKLEGSYSFDKVKATLGYELLGSDDGLYGFATPLATAHKFNGWADIFLGTPPAGLEDIYATLAGKAAGGKWSVTYHDFSADEGSADLGSEIDAVYGKAFNKTYSGGIKLAMYSAGDSGVDTDKVWLWVGAKF
ncbi:MAG: alginate export family protein [Thalassotalea sp.]